MEETPGRPRTNWSEHISDLNEQWLEFNSINMYNMYVSNVICNVIVEVAVVFLSWVSVVLVRLFVIL